MTPGSGATGSGPPSGPVDPWSQLAGAINALSGGTGPVQQICDLWKQAAATYFGALAAWLESSEWAGAGPDPDHGKATVELDPAAATGNWVVPQGLRALGWGTQFRIQPGDVTVTIAGNYLTADVYFGHVTPGERIRTVVYQGEVVNDLPNTIMDPSITITVVKPAFSA
jgi:hypothetical protein